MGRGLKTLVVGCTLLASAGAQPPRMTPAQVGINYDIVAVRVPRNAQPLNTHFPDAFTNSLHTARGGELVRIRPDGTISVLFSLGAVRSIVDPIVSNDLLGESCTSVFDAQAGMALNDQFMKLVAWYDNEWAYSCKCIDLMRHMAAHHS